MTPACTPGSADRHSRPELIGGELILLRHCQTEWNRLQLYQGRRNPPLSEAGISEAQQLAGQLRASLRQPVSIVSSPLARAHMTAAIIASVTSAAVSIDDRLTELSYGLWEGHTQATVKRLWPQLLRQWKWAPETVNFPEGECLAGLRDRVRSFFEDAVERSEPLLVVTHDGVIRIAALEALGLPLSDFRAVKTANGALVAFARRKDGLVLTSAAHVTFGDAVARAFSDKNLTRGEG